MKLTHEDLKFLCSIAKEAALKAGVMIESYLSTDPERQQIQISSKTTGSSKASQIVTEVDLKSEHIILQLLKPTLLEFDLALLSEESIDDHSRLEKDYFWCIDPLDGTLAFIESRPGFSISIALVSNDGKPQIGVVYDPSSQTLYSAVKGQGVFRNKRALEGLVEKEVLGDSSRKILSDKPRRLTIIAETNLIKSENFQIIKNELECFVKDQEWGEIKLLEGGGAVLNACQVFENSPAVYFKLPKPTVGGGSIWDFAATSAIFEELGTPVSDVFGEALALNKEGSTFMNDCGVIYASDQSLLKEIIKIYAQVLKDKK